jgi:hypothetical protein
VSKYETFEDVVRACSEPPTIFSKSRPIRYVKNSISVLSSNKPPPKHKFFERQKYRQFM